MTEEINLESAVEAVFGFEQNDYHVWSHDEHNGERYNMHSKRFLGPVYGVKYCRRTQEVEIGFYLQTPLCQVTDVDQLKEIGRRIDFIETGAQLLRPHFDKIQISHESEYLLKCTLTTQIQNQGHLLDLVQRLKGLDKELNFGQLNEIVSKKPAAPEDSYKRS